MSTMYEIISKKRDGLPLDSEEIDYFINGYVKGDIPDYQISALLMAIYIRGMNEDETSNLTMSMMRSGDIINFDDIDGKKIDKHSTGGVGDKVSLLLAPLVASCGVYVPMLAGRGLGHTGGTLDKLESIPGFNVNLDLSGFKTALKSSGMAICGQTENIVPADRKLYVLRDATATVSSIPLIASSIMSKKLALGSDGIVMDIKTGSGAFMREKSDAINLAKIMISIGGKLGRNVSGIITSMNKPLGTSVGNALEVIETLECLKGNGDPDLMEVTLSLGALMLISASRVTDFYEGIEMLKMKIDSGEGLDRFMKFISAQGGDEGICEKYDLLGKAKYVEEVIAPAGGYISEIDTYEVGLASIDIGAGRMKKEDGIDHGTGFVFEKNTGDHVAAGDEILKIYYNDEEKMKSARKRLESAIKITDKKPLQEQNIYYYIDKNGLKDWEYTLG